MRGARTAAGAPVGRVRRGVAAAVLLAVPAFALGIYLGAQGATRNEGLASLLALAVGFALFAVSKPR